MSEFKGFPREFPGFFEKLGKNNSKKWFDENRKDYEDYVKKPSMEFVVTMGERLREIVPEINAIPKVNKSLFRINRDTRFSNDKTPYKTTMGLWLWEGEKKRMECSGFYIHTEEGRLYFGCGVYIFPRDILADFRDAAVDKKLGPELTRAVKKVTGKGYSIERKHYKRTPQGFDSNHANAELLLFNGLHAGIEIEKLPKEFFTKKLIDVAFEHYKNMMPIHEWLMKIS